MSAPKFALLPDDYFVTPYGAVFSHTNWRGCAERELRQFIHRGYYTVRVTVAKGKRKRMFVHQLVAWFFCGERPSLLHEVRHLNGNPLDNRADNLAWGTQKDNADDRERHGRTSRGEKHSIAIRGSGHAAAVRAYFRARKESIYV